MFSTLMFYISWHSIMRLHPENSEDLRIKYPSWNQKSLSFAFAYASWVLFFVCVSSSIIATVWQKRKVTVTVLWESGDPTWCWETTPSNRVRWLDFNSKALELQLSHCRTPGWWHWSNGLHFDLCTILWY